MHLRPAQLSDAGLLQHWHGKPHVLTAIGDFAEVDWVSELGHSPPWRELLIAEVDGRAIGVIQIIDAAREETHYWGDVEGEVRAIDMWIGEEDCVGRGYGTQMMRLALDRCFAEAAVTAVLIDPLASNTRARRFYERCGYQPVGPRVFGADACFVYRMDRQAWQDCR
jgi:aminoglycoside 6'-N-acetyltransferase